MFLIIDGWNSIKRNQRDVWIYLGLMSLFLLLLGGAGVALGIRPDEKPAWLPAYSFCTDLLQAAAFSAIMAIIFARLGEDIDRPLWRCPSDAEALQRFFLPWIILHLSSFTLMNLAVRADEANRDEIAGSLFMVWMCFSVIILPLGTCVMFHGRLRWSELGVALRPLVARFDLSLIVVGVLILQMLLLLLLTAGMAGEQAPKEDFSALIRRQVFFWPLIAIPFNLLDCLAFSMMWRVCMIHRDDSLEEEDPYDF